MSDKPMFSDQKYFDHLGPIAQSTHIREGHNRFARGGKRVKRIARSGVEVDASKNPVLAARVANRRNKTEGEGPLRSTKQDRELVQAAKRSRRSQSSKASTSHVSRQERRKSVRGAKSAARSARKGILTTRVEDE